MSFLGLLEIKIAVYYMFETKQKHVCSNTNIKVHVAVTIACLPCYDVSRHNIYTPYASRGWMYFYFYFCFHLFFTRYFQLGSWFYYRGPDNGVMLWEPKPEVFPHGLKYTNLF